MDRRHRLRAALTVTLPLLLAPLATTAGVLLGGALHRAVPSVGLPGTAVPGAVAVVLVRHLGAGVTQTYGR